MAISHSASTAISTATSAKGATGTSVAYPAGVAAGRVAVLAVQCKPESLTITTPTGWTKIGEATGGTGAAMTADVGPTKLALYYRVLTGTETGSVTVTSTGNAMTGTTTGVMSIYEGTLGGWAVPTAVFGSDATHGTNVSATLGAWASTPAQGDIVLAFYSADTDSTASAGAATLTATGFSYAAPTARSRQGNGDGFDATLFSWQTRVSTHTAGSTAAPAFALTWTASSCGPVAAVRLHEVAPVSTLVDTFDDGVIGADTWPYSYGAVTETGGRAQTPASAGYTGFNAAHCYTLNEAGLMLQAFPAAVNGATTGEVYSAAWINSVSQAAGTQIGFKVDTALGIITFQNQTAYFDADRVTIPYDPAAHAWWRLQLVAGQLVWSTSPDGRTWTVRRTAAAPAYVAGAQDFRVFLESHRDSGTDNVAEWDNANVVPAPAASPAALLASAVLGAPSAAVALAAGPAGLPVAAVLGSPAANLLPTGPAGVAAAAVLGAPTVTLPGASPSALTAAAALGAPSTAVGRSVAPSGLTAGAALGGPAVSIPAASPAGLAAAAKLGAPATAVPGCQPGGVAAAAVLGAPRVQTAVVPDGLVAAAVLGAPSTGPARAAAPAAFAAAVVLGSPTTAVPAASPAALVAAAVLGAPSAGAVSLAAVTPDSIVAAAALGAPASALARSAAPMGLSVQARLGQPATGLSPARPAALAAAASLGAPATAPSRSASPTAVVAAALVGDPAAALLGASPDALTAIPALGSPSVPVVPDSIVAVIVLGSLRAGAHPAVYRPAAGRVPRRGDGMVPRIPAGMVSRL